MFGRDKKEAFEALTTAQQKLNAAWDQWKKNQSDAWEGRREQARERRETFERRVEGNIDKLRDRLGRLESVLAHERSHLRDLEDKRSDARSDEFRSVVSGWIDEEESAIEDIRSKIREVEGWIEEEQSKLRR